MDPEVVDPPGAAAPHRFPEQLLHRLAVVVHLHPGFLRGAAAPGHQREQAGRGPEQLGGVVVAVEDEDREPRVGLLELDEGGPGSLAASSGGCSYVV